MAFLFPERRSVARGSPGSLLRTVRRYCGGNSSRREVSMKGWPLAASGLLAAMLAGMPGAALACACGCAIFDVGTSTLLPAGPGGTLFLEWDYLDQNRNWSGDSSAPKADNDDKNIRTNFTLLGGQYMFNDSWGVMAEVPYTERHFVTADSGSPETFNHGALGDVRLMGVYSGFSPDMSTGVIAGVKLPTGDNTFKHFDPDVEIGSGSTDLLLGAYHTGTLDAAGDFQWFAQALWQHETPPPPGVPPAGEGKGGRPAPPLPPIGISAPALPWLRCCRWWPPTAAATAASAISATPATRVCWCRPAWRSAPPIGSSMPMSKCRSTST